MIFGDKSKGANPDPSWQDHEAVGMEILLSRPSRLMRLTILVVFLMVVAAAAWAFVGKADVIVKTQGILTPEGEVRRIYVPIDGEIVENYMLEGSLITEGDVLTRINAPGAVQLAGQTANAKLKLQDAERKAALFPDKRSLMKAKVELLRTQIASEEALQNKRLEQSMAKIEEQHKLKLEKIQVKLDRAARDMEAARRDWQKHVRLRRTPGEGGVSKQKVDQKHTAYLSKRTEYQLKKAELSEFELEWKKEKQKKYEEIEKKSEVLRNLRVQLSETRLQMQQEDVRAKTELLMAQAAVRNAERITFDDLDEDSFLLVKAPVSGILSSVAVTQVGEKVESKKPIAGIAPADARMLLELEIPERNRAFLREGMPIKVKLNAFPYQRYGVIKGVLEYIAPAATLSVRDKKAIVFKAKAALEKDHVQVQGIRYPFRYGMQGIAEIVVRKRRLIDMALDPFRNVAG